MTDIEFANLLRKIGHCFVRAPKISKEVADLAFEMCGHIEASHCDAILRRFASLEKFPENLGNSIYAAYCAAVPLGQRSSVGDPARPKFCPICDPGPWQGKIVAFQKEADGSVLKFFFDCPRCNPGSPHKATREQITSLGYIVPPKPSDVAKYYYRMFVANNPMTVQRNGTCFHDLLGDPRRLSQAAAPLPPKED